MTRHRLVRLALLTQGAALLGLSASAGGCSKEPSGDNTLHINAPMPQPDAGSAAESVQTAPTPSTPASPTDADAQAPFKLRGPILNAPPRPLPST